MKKKYAITDKNGKKVKIGLFTEPEVRMAAKAGMRVFLLSDDDGKHSMEITQERSDDFSRRQAASMICNWAGLTPKILTEYLLMEPDPQEADAHTIAEFQRVLALTDIPYSKEWAVGIAMTAPMVRFGQKLADCLREWQQEQGKAEDDAKKVSAAS